MSTKLRRLIAAWHRDLGYFFTGFVLLYAISGLAVNHADHWDPDFIIERREVPLDLPANPEEISLDRVRASLASLDGVGTLKAFDFPSSLRIKIYLDDGSIVARLGAKSGEYETIRRRPILYGANRLHLNPKGWWRIVSDIFAAALVVLALSGLLILKGRKGFAGRGKWLVAAGFALPIVAGLVSA